MLLDATCESMGIPVRAAHTAVLTRDMPDDVAPRSACFNATPCGRGCTIGAMFQTTTSFLPMAKATRSEEHTSELQSLMRISYAVFCLTKKISTKYNNTKTKRIQYERKK